jgi:hypothetical protein
MHNVLPTALWLTTYVLCVVLLCLTELKAMALAINSNANVVVMTVGISAGEEAMYVGTPLKPVRNRLQMQNCLQTFSLLLIL